MNLACPACEYERGHRGKPSVQGNTATCLDCGTSWKELGTKPQLSVQKESSAGDKFNAPVDPRVFNNRHFETQNSDSKPAHFVFDKQSQNATSWPSARQGVVHSWRNAAVAICFLVSGFAGWSLFGGTMLNGMSNFASPWTKVRIEDVVMREVRNSRGNRVITVEGALSNAASSGQTVPTIEIILRRANGQEIHRWLHNPPLAKMKPQSNARFVSSIQHDNARIAYAEAEFVD